MKKGLRFLAVFFIFSLILQTGVFAEKEFSITNTENGVYMIRSRDEIEKDFEELRNAAEEEVKALNSITPFDQYAYEYKVEYLPRTKAYASGKLDGQPTAGTRIDGYITVNESKGTPVTVSVSVGMPKVKYVTIDVELGKYTGTSVTGGSIRLPNPNKYYLAYADKVYEVDGYITYRRLRNSNDDWSVYTKTIGKSLYSQHFYVKEV